MERTSDRPTLDAKTWSVGTAASDRRTSRKRRLSTTHRVIQIARLSVLVSFSGMGLRNAAASPAGDGRSRLPPSDSTISLAATQRRCSAMPPSPIITSIACSTTSAATSRSRFPAPGRWLAPQPGNGTDCGLGHSVAVSVHRPSRNNACRMVGGPAECAECPASA